MRDAANDGFTLNEKNVRDFYAEFLGSADLSAFVTQRCSEDIIWENFLPADIPFGGAWRGRAAVIDYLQRMMQVIRITSFEINSVVVEGTTAVIFGSEQSEVIPNSKSYAMDWVHRLEFSSPSRVCRAREYNDTAAMHRAFVG